MTWVIVVAIVVLGIIFAGKLLAYGQRRATALNVVHAALTYRSLSPGQAGAVDGQVASICRRLGIKDPIAEAMLRPEVAQVYDVPSVIYALRSLAMRELGIRPWDTDRQEWFVLRNPFSATFAMQAIAQVRQHYERKHGVRLTELGDVTH